MKRQAWQDLRLRFVISHSLVAGQLYSIFPESKHRDGHPGIMFSPWIQGQAAVPRYFHHCQSVNVAGLLIHLHTHPRRLYPADLAKGWLQCWVFRHVSSRHVVIPWAAPLETWPVPWRPGMRVGAVQTLLEFPLLPVLLHVCRMDVTCPFLSCLGN